MIVENPRQAHFLPVQLVTLPSRIFEDFSHAHEAARSIATKSNEPIFIVRFEIRMVRFSFVSEPAIRFRRRQFIPRRFPL